MANKIWDGLNWKEYKNLKVFSGSWKDAAKGWINTNSGWRQWYPEYPVNTALPSISGTLVRGNVLTVSDGTWRGFPSDKAFSYTQTAYQWLRNGSAISGATGNQYTTTTSDIGTNIISCRVRVTNNRGFTDATSSTVTISGQTYTLTYNANGGIVLGNASTSTSVTEGSSVTLPAATRTGYTFNGWYTAASGGSYIGTTNNTYTPTSTVTIYAQWTAATYTVSYDANGGTGAPGSQTKTHDVTLTLSNTTPSRTGYTFSGWNTASAGGGTAYSAGGSYTANAATTLYAQWTALTYTVSYDANGGTGAPGSQTKTYGVTLTLSSTTPTRTGYTFSGWNTASNGGGTAYSAGGSYTTNAAATLYAQWTALTYTVSYDANGGTGAPASQTKTHDVTLTLSSTTPTRTNFTFSGWNTASNGGGTAYSAGGSYTTNAAATLYAQWTAATTPPSGGSVTLSGTATVGQTLTATTSGWSGTTPLTYALKITRGTQFVVTTETTVAGPSNVTSLTYTIPSGDVGYYYKSFVTVTNSAGSSTQFSNELGPVTGSGGGGAPAVPTGLYGFVYVGCNYTSLAWNAVSGATSYELAYSTGTTRPASPTTTGITTAYYTLQAESYPYFWIRARNSSGASDWSAMATMQYNYDGSC